MIFAPPAFHFRGRKESGGPSSLLTHDLSEIIYLSINPTDVQVRAEILEIGNNPLTWVVLQVQFLLQVPTRKLDSRCQIRMQVFFSNTDMVAFL